jgi:hypothetical protein
VIRPWRDKMRCTVGLEIVIWWSWARCQMIVSAPASSPSATSRSRTANNNSTIRCGVVRGEVRGRRERGSNAPSPSAR